MKVYHVEMKNNYLQPASLLDLTEDERGLIEASRKGKSIMMNCAIGFMVHIAVKDGMLHVNCRSENPDVRGEAEAEHVRAVIESWSASLREYDSRRGE